MIMNTLVFALVLTSILLLPTALFHSPRHEVFVKVDKDADGTTKVVISPHDAVPVPSGSGPSNSVCDAYGKCNHVISTAFAKTKESVTNTMHEVSEKVQEIKDLSEAKHTAGVSLGSFKSFVVQGISRIKEFAGDVTAKVKDDASKDFDIVDSPKRIGEDISRNVTESANEMTMKNVRKLGKKSWNEIVLKLKEGMYDVVWCMLCKDRIGSVVGLVHMFGFSTAYGVCVWVSFVSSYVLGRYLTRGVFGMVQSWIYPVYFKVMSGCICGALFGHLAGLKSEILSSKMGMFQSLCLVSALLMVLVNLMVLEPKATKAMYERMKIQKEEGKGVGAANTPKDGMAGVMGNGGGAIMRNGSGARMVKSAASVVAERQDVWRLNEKEEGTGVGVAAAPKDGMAGVMGNGNWNGGGAMRNGSGTRMMKSAAERQDILRLNEKLKRLNAYSSALNLSTLVVLTWHMAYMGQLLQASS